MGLLGCLLGCWVVDLVSRMRSKRLKVRINRRLRIFGRLSGRKDRSMLLSNVSSRNRVSDRKTMIDKNVWKRWGNVCWLVRGSRVPSKSKKNSRMFKSRNSDRSRSRCSWNQVRSSSRWKRVGRYWYRRKVMARWIGR